MTQGSHVKTTRPELVMQKFLGPFEGIKSNSKNPEAAKVYMIRCTFPPSLLVTFYPPWEALQMYILNYMYMYMQ